MISSQPVLDSSSGHTNRPLHVLSLTPFYPVKGDDGRGCFIAEPLPWLAQLGMTNTVVATQPFYRGHVETSDLAVPAHWRRYFSFPGSFGLPASGRFLFSGILSEVRKVNGEH